VSTTWNGSASTPPPRTAPSRRASPSAAPTPETSPATPTPSLTDHPVVRFVGTDDPDQTRTGWQPWLPVITGWLAEGRSRTVFVHTPDNVATPPLARRLYDDIRRDVPALAPLPEPIRAGPPAEDPTLFPDEPDDTVPVPGR
jgi:hypothetical protein